MRSNLLRAAIVTISIVALFEGDLSGQTLTSVSAIATAGRDRIRGVAAGNGVIISVGEVGASVDNQPYLGGPTDAFIQARNSVGVVLWTQLFGTTAEDVFEDVALDADGNIYVAGWTRGMLPGSTNGYAAEDGFVVKYSPDGDKLWHKVIPAASIDYGLLATGIAVSAAGDVAVVGHTVNVGGFLARFQPDGTFVVDLNSFPIHASAAAGPARVAIDAAGFIYVSSAADFPHSEVRRYSNAGVLVSTTVVAGAVTNITPRPSGGVAVSGWSPGGLIPAAAQGTLTAFEADGALAPWSPVTFGTPGPGNDDVPLDLVAQSNGNLLLVGQIDGSSGGYFQKLGVWSFHANGQLMFESRLVVDVPPGEASTHRHFGGAAAVIGGSLYIGGSMRSLALDDAFLAVVSVPTPEPVLTLPLSVTQTGSLSSTPVVFSATATDDVDPFVAVDCTPASGDGFLFGTTPVTCSATDSDGHTTVGSFNVTITISDVIAQGPVGQQGLQGAQGATGATGPQGVQGTVGPIGPTGPEGPMGPQGPIGPTGAIGATGPGGAQGIQGETGAQGIRGELGPTGAMGPQGTVGPIGPSGVAGPTGSSGSQGVQGATGPQGETGAQGTQGPQGTQGATGATGPQGVQGTVGPIGPTGPEGPAGAIGATGPGGAQGIQGETGAQGIRGELGLPGLQGDKGAPGVAGTPGAKGDRGDTGEQGRQGSQGIQGVKGDQGPQGGLGPQGPIGPEGVVPRNARGAYNLSNVFGFVGSTTELFETDPPHVGAGVHFSWYAGKGAFRAGMTKRLNWSAANTGLYSVAMGADNLASGNSSFAMGANTRARGNQSTALGYETNANGVHSVALGAWATAQDGSFVFGDSSTTNDPIWAGDPLREVVSGRNMFVVRAVGGVSFFTSAKWLTGCNLTAGSGSWQCSSSRTMKERVEGVDGETLLQRLRYVPVTTWNYIAEGTDVRHMGPFAEDFHNAFGLGTSETAIGLQDIDGVNMAAIQALDGRSAATKDAVSQLEREGVQLRKELDELKQALAALVKRMGGS